MDAPTNDFDKTAGERVEEYKMLMQNLAEYGSRRLTINAVFVGFNTVFLAALGTVLASAKFDSWRTAVAVGVVTLVIMPVNVLWRSTLAGYQQGLDLRYGYIKKLEAKFRDHWHDPDVGLVSLLNQPKPKERLPYRHTSLERRLAGYFLILYPVIAVIVAVLTYLIANKLIPSF